MAPPPGTGGELVGDAVTVAPIVVITGGTSGWGDTLEDVLPPAASGEEQATGAPTNPPAAGAGTDEDLRRVGFAPDAGGVVSWCFKEAAW